jgi:hypothetical protein
VLFLSRSGGMHPSVVLLSLASVPPGERAHKATVGANDPVDLGFHRSHDERMLIANIRAQNHPRDKHPAGFLWRAALGRVAEAFAPPPPFSLPDYELLRRIGGGASGGVWLARSTTGALRAVKIVWRRTFEDDRPFQREFEGIQRFERVSREHPSQLALFHVGRNEAAGCFYYVMELADPVESPKAEIRLPKETRSPKPETTSPATNIRASDFLRISELGIRVSPARCSSAPGRGPCGPGHVPWRPRPAAPG